MRARTSVISVPVSLVYAAAALSTGQPIIVALGTIMVFVAAGYLISELQLRRSLQNWPSTAPAKVDETPGNPGLRELELSRPSVGERIFPAIFVAATIAITVLLGAYAAGLEGR